MYGRKRCWKLIITHISIFKICKFHSLLLYFRIQYFYICLRQWQIPQGENLNQMNHSPNHFDSVYENMWWLMFIHKMKGSILHYHINVTQNNKSLIKNYIWNKCKLLHNLLPSKCICCFVVFKDCRLWTKGAYLKSPSAHRCIFLFA